ncbi:MAG: glutamate synthase-related protein, partial [Cytophagales bacterium]
FRSCPVGSATQKEHLRHRIIIDHSAKQLQNFFHASNELIKVVARACGHKHVKYFNFSDLTTLDYKMHQLTGIAFSGIK